MNASVYKMAAIANHTLCSGRHFVLYIDVLFLENLLADYLLLSLLNWILKYTSGRLRRLSGAVIGSLGVCGLYLFSLETTWLGRLLIYMIFSTVMVKTGLGIRSLHECRKAVVLLYICSFLLGGIFQWVQGRFKLPFYPFAGFTLVSYWILSACMKWLISLRERLGNVFETVVGFHGRTIRVKGLLDTGNMLRDPVFQRPVSILTESARRELCGNEEPLYQMIPFHSLGEPKGLMPAFFADYLCIFQEDGGERRIERPLLGVAREPLSSQKEYEMILHPDLLE